MGVLRTGSTAADLLVGTSTVDTLSGLAGNDTLDGGADNDWLYGGLGDDVYIVDSALDQVIEYAGEGIDRVQSSISWTLGQNLENLTLTGPALTGTGNALANVITGNDLANTIYGLGDNDWIDGGYGNNVLDGGTGNDTIIGSNRDIDAELLFGGDGNDSINAGSGADTIQGGAGNDTIIGNGFGAVISGGTGNDSISARTGAATILFGRGDGQDTLGARPDTATSANTLQFGAGIAKSDIDGRVSGSDLVLSLRGTTDSVTLQQFYAASPFSGPGVGTRMTGAQIVRFADGSQWTLDDLKAIVFAGTIGNDSIRGSYLADTLSGGAGNDTLAGYEGNDTYIVDSLLDQVVEQTGAGTDTVITSVSGWTLGANVENLTLSGSALIGTGNALANVLLGSAAANRLYGGDGSDTLDGAAGDDALYGQNGNDSLVGQDGVDWLDGGTGADTMRGGTGNDTYVVDDLADQIVENLDEGIDVVRSSIDWTLGDHLETLILSGTSALRGTGNTLNNRITAGDPANLLDGGDGNDTLDGGAGSDTLIGGAGVDSLLGGIGNDSLVGQDGVDWLDGGTGADTMRGGTGNDTYVVDDLADQIVENLDEGIDVVRSSIDWTLGDHLETLILSGTSALRGIGNTLNNRITAGDPANLLDGGDGNDTLDGGAGNDTLIGGAGADSLLGGIGNDTYIVDSLLDQVVEQTGAGTDTVITSVSGWTLGANLENLTLTGSALTGTGNELANVITGNDLANAIYGLDGDDSLNGLQGNDSLYGGAGNDTLRGDMGTLTFHGGTGNDLLQTGGMGSMTAYFGRGDGQDTIGGHADWANSINTLQFTGSISKSDIDLSVVNKSLVLTLRGTTDSVTIDRFYNFSHPSVEGFNIGGGMSGVQQVRFADGSSWTLDDLKNIIFSGTTANDFIEGSFGGDVISGGSGNDTLGGQGGNDWLDGGTGDDRLVGGSGNDTYIVDSLQDQVIESPYGFLETDTVITSVSGWTLGTNVENLTLAGSALTGTGNELANVITGNDLANTLYGLDGNDTIYAMAGNDWIDGGYGSNTIDGGAGNDTILGSVIHADYILGGDGNDSITGGFEGADTILGGAGNDTISANGNAMITGGTGNDVLRSLGASTFVFNRGDGQDVIGARTDTAVGSNTLQFGAGITQADVAVTLSGNDLVLSLRGTTDSVTLNMYRNPWVPMQGADLGGRLSGAQIVRFADGSQWGPDELRTLALTGTAGNDSIRGSYLADTLSGMEGSDTLLGYEGDDWLDGGSGMDVMYGGTGNDTYVVNHMDDQTIEFANQGTDTVICSVTDWTLSANAENLTMIGSAWFGHGNASANVIVGSQRSNELYGLDGDDTIYGMGGNDIIIGGAGNSQLHGGDGSDTLAGDEGNDLLNGESGDDRLYAYGGQNTLQGGTGNDTIWAGAGADTYLFSRGDGIDLVVESQDAGAASDQILFQSGIGHDQLWLSRSGNSLQISVVGTSDQVTIQDWYLGQAGHVEQIRTSTGRVLLDTKVDALVSAMAAMVPPAAGQTSLSTTQQMLLAPVLAASWS